MDKIAKTWMALQHVRRARALLREVGSDPAADTLARAVKSAEGAYRHARGVEDRRKTVRACMNPPPLAPDWPFESTPNRAGDGPLLVRPIHPGSVA